MPLARPHQPLVGPGQDLDSLGQLLGKEYIEVRDSPGFATSRLGLVIGREAIRMVEEGVASPHDIDRGMELGYRGRCVSLTWSA